MQSRHSLNTHGVLSEPSVSTHPYLEIRIKTLYEYSVSPHRDPEADKNTLTEHSVSTHIRKRKGNWEMEKEEELEKESVNQALESHQIFVMF